MPPPAAAASGGQGGAVIVRIPDGAQSRCIGAAQDRIWLTLRRAIIDKKGGWLTTDASVSVLVRAQMRVSSGRPLTFPLMAEANVAAYSEGQVSVPIEYTFIDGFPLKQDGVTYSGASIDMTIFNQRAKSTWGSALTALSEVAKKLPLPVGPITQSVTYLMDFATAALDKDTKKVDLNDQAKSATVSLNFDPTGVCTAGDFEKTGTLAVLQDSAAQNPGVVRVADADSYCWSAQLTPAFILKAAPKDSAFACANEAHYAPAYRQVANNYVGLVLNAIRARAGTAGPTGGAPDVDAANALRRCEANGIPQEQCVGQP